MRTGMTPEQVCDKQAAYLADRALIRLATMAAYARQKAQVEMAKAEEA